MSATNKTTNYNLPLFIGSDVPSWLVDWNNAMTELDSSIKTVSDSVGDASTLANNAVNTANATATSLVNLSNSVSTLSSSLTSLTDNVSSWITYNLTPTTDFSERGVTSRILVNKQLKLAVMVFSIYASSDTVSPGTVLFKDFPAVSDSRNLSLVLDTASATTSAPYPISVTLSGTNLSLYSSGLKYLYINHLFCTSGWGGVYE